MSRLVDAVNDQLRTVAEHDRGRPWREQLLGAHAQALVLLLGLAILFLSL